MFYFILLLVIVFLSYKLIDKHTHDIEINREEIYNDQVKNDFNILHLSDLHFNFNKNYQEKLVNIINNIEYDLIVFTGDYINKTNYILNLDQFFSSIKNKEYAYAVLGNNDYNYDLERLKTTFSQNEIKLLNNENEELELRNNKINLVGVESPDLKNDDLKTAVKDLNFAKKINILLSHTYHVIEREGVEEFNLVLVGDTHGGQINIPFLLKKLKKYFDIKYKSGKYILNHLILMVNRGIGTNILPIRINCKPEILLIKISNS